MAPSRDGKRGELESAEDAGGPCGTAATVEVASMTRSKRSPEPDVDGGGGGVDGADATGMGLAGTAAEVERAHKRQKVGANDGLDLLTGSPADAHPDNLTQMRVDADSVYATADGQQGSGAGAANESDEVQAARRQRTPTPASERGEAAEKNRCESARADADKLLPNQLLSASVVPGREGAGAGGKSAGAPAAKPPRAYDGTSAPGHPWGKLVSLNPDVPNETMCGTAYQFWVGVGGKHDLKLDARKARATAQERSHFRLWRSGDTVSLESLMRAAVTVNGRRSMHKGATITLKGGDEIVVNFAGEDEPRAYVFVPVALPPGTEAPCPKKFLAKRTISKTAPAVGEAPFASAPLEIVEAHRKAVVEARKALAGGKVATSVADKRVDELVAQLVGTCKQEAGVHAAGAGAPSAGAWPARLGDVLHHTGMDAQDIAGKVRQVKLARAKIAGLRTASTDASGQSAARQVQVAETAGTTAADAKQAPPPPVDAMVHEAAGCKATERLVAGGSTSEPHRQSGKDPASVAPEDLVSELKKQMAMDKELAMDADARAGGSKEQKSSGRAGTEALRKLVEAMPMDAKAEDLGAVLIALAEEEGARGKVPAPGRMAPPMNLQPPRDQRLVNTMANLHVVKGARGLKAGSRGPPPPLPIFSELPKGAADAAKAWESSGLLPRLESREGPTQEAMATVDAPRADSDAKEEEEEEEEEAKDKAALRKSIEAKLLEHYTCVENIKVSRGSFPYSHLSDAVWTALVHTGFLHINAAQLSDHIGQLPTANSRVLLVGPQHSDQYLVSLVQSVAAQLKANILTFNCETARDMVPAPAVSRGAADKTSRDPPLGRSERMYVSSLGGAMSQAHAMLRESLGLASSSRRSRRDKDRGGDDPLPMLRGLVSLSNLNRPKGGDRERGGSSEGFSKGERVQYRGGGSKRGPSGDVAAPSIGKTKAWFADMPASASKGPRLGQRGEVVVTFDDNPKRVGVRFDARVAGGIDLGGACPRGRGYFCDTVDLCPEDERDEEERGEEVVLDALFSLIECKAREDPLVVCVHGLEQWCNPDSTERLVHLKRKLGKVSGRVFFVAACAEDCQPKPRSSPSSRLGGSSSLMEISSLLGDGGPGGSVERGDGGRLARMLSTVFPHKLVVGPPSDGTRASVWMKELEADAKTQRLQKTHASLWRVMRRNHLECASMNEVDELDAAMDGTDAERVLAWALSKHLQEREEAGEPLLPAAQVRALAEHEAADCAVGELGGGAADGAVAAAEDAQAVGSAAPRGGVAPMEEVEPASKEAGPATPTKVDARMPAKMQLPAACINAAIALLKTARGEAEGGARGKLRSAALENEFEKRLLSDVIPAEEVGVRFDDIGALDKVKDTLKELVMLPLSRPELFKRGSLTQPCKGVLLFGPPGTGKTMLARAVATEAGANFINVSMSSIASKWFGEVRGRVSAAIARACKVRLCCTRILGRTRRRALICAPLT